MRNRIVILLIISVFIIASCAESMKSISYHDNSTNDAWKITSLFSERSVGRCTSIAKDNQDGIYISYYNESGAIELASKSVKSNWTNEKIREINWISSSSSIVIDNQNSIHMVYSVFQTTSCHLCYSYKPYGGNWSDSLIENGGETGKFGGIVTIAIDKYCGVHVGYINLGNGEVKYAYKPQNGSWTKIILDSVNNKNSYLDLAVDNDAGVHMAYLDGTTGWLKYAYKAYNGMWNKTYADNSTNCGLWPSIAIDKDNGVHISHYDQTHCNLRYTYKPNGGAWTSTTADPAYAVGGYTSIGVDNNNGVHISYYDYTQKNLKYAYQPSGGIWSNETVDSNGNVGSWSSLVVDSQNNIHISYFDEGNYDLKYASSKIHMIVYETTLVSIPILMIAIFFIVLERTRRIRKK